MVAKRTTGKLHLLTARQLQAAGKGDHGDGGGLVLRVQDDSCAWVFRYTSPAGKRREMGLGVARRGSTAQCGESLTTARRLAHEAREHLQRDIDPLEERARRRHIAQEADRVKKADRVRDHWTLARSARDYHERVIEPTRSAKHAAQWISSLENHMPGSLWNRPIGEVDPPLLLEALTNIRPHERARNLTDDHRVSETIQRIRQRLDAVFEDAIFHKRCVSNPAAAIRRKMREAGLSLAPAGRFASLPYKEAPGLMARLRQGEGTASRCLEFAMLTAARTGEVLGAAWSEFDLDAGVWTVPAGRMKGSEEHVVHLSPAALSVLQRQAGLDSAIVFPSSMQLHDGSNRPLSNMAMLAVLDRLRMRDQTTVHGLCRATFSTWAYDSGAARPDVIEACLAHREADKVKAAYNRAQFTRERKALLKAWADYLAQPAADVVQLDRAA